MADREAQEFLAAAYPEEAARRRAGRWLGLAARQAGDGEIRWWEMSAPEDHFEVP